MKTLAAILGLFVIVANSSVANPVMIRLEVSYEGVEAKWFADLSSDTKKILNQNGDSVVLPTVVARPEEKAALEIIREYMPSWAKSKEDGVPCGVVIEFNPKIVPDGIHISGSSTLRRSTTPDDNEAAIRFEAQQLILDNLLENGQPKAIAMEGGAQMVVTATLVEATGQSTK
ncbi:hypothetical protein ACFQY0_17005 [Haloferula chungangensis]|uniref:Uncharacterized protein n=1 Tax=Haloferula chungangensis TaxID=1048331 RepID=A0ABW2L912_9BACT